MALIFLYILYNERSSFVKSRSIGKGMPSGGGLFLEGELWPIADPTGGVGEINARLGRGESS